MSENKLSAYCLKYAQSKLSKSMIFHNGSAEKKQPISFAIYLIHSNDKNILVDAGCDTMPGFVMDWHFSPLCVLKQTGISAKEITDVVITHAHHDHIEAVKYFTNATIHISKAAYEKGEKYIPDSFKISTFENELIINPQIRVIECGGHSKGSSIVEIKTADKIHIIAGDECYTNANIENRICTGTFYNKKNAIAFVEKYGSEKYRVHTCHDISLKTERII